MRGLGGCATVYHYRGMESYCAVRRRRRRRRFTQSAGQSAHTI